MIHYMLLSGYILVICHKNNIVISHVTFMLYRCNETCLLGINCCRRIRLGIISYEIHLLVMKTKSNNSFCA